MYKSYIYTTFYKFVHKPGLFCFSFSFLSRDKYSTNLTIYEKQRWGDRMVGAHGTTELWRHLQYFFMGNTVLSWSSSQVFSIVNT